MMKSDDTYFGNLLVRFGSWSLVFVCTSFYVPKMGIVILLNAGPSDIIASLLGIPVLLLWSALPIAICSEVLVDWLPVRQFPTSKVVAGLTISVVMVTVWGYGEPYLYLGFMHPYGLAGYETLLMTTIGCALTCSLFWTWNNVVKEYEDTGYSESRGVSRFVR